MKHVAQLCKRHSGLDEQGLGLRCNIERKDKKSEPGIAQRCHNAGGQQNKASTNKVQRHCTAAFFLNTVRLLKFFLPCDCMYKITHLWSENSQLEKCALFLRNCVITSERTLLGVVMFLRTGAALRC